MVDVSIKSHDLALNMNIVLIRQNKPEFGAEEIIFTDFEELRNFLEEVLIKIGVDVVEDDY